MLDNAPLKSLPDLPAHFWDTFTSQFIKIDTLQLHAVTGGHGIPILLVGGWPQTWFAWRHVMARLVSNFTVIAVDCRGVGLSDKPVNGYDSTTLAADLASMMTRLGHDQFHVVGFDIGMWTGYALAADFPDRVLKLAVAEATIPGLLPSPPFLGPKPLNDFLWHLAFNRAGPIALAMVEGREDLYFGHQFTSKSATPDSLPKDVMQVYIDALKAQGALKASFAFWDVIDQIAAQTTDRKQRRLAVPVLALGGSKAVNDRVAQDMRELAVEVEEIIVAGCDHYMPEEAPEAMAHALLSFFQR